MVRGAWKIAFVLILTLGILDCNPRLNNGSDLSPALRVFVTSTTTFGDFGNGDTICQNLAAGANLSGTWKAILSTSSSEIKNNLSGAQRVVLLDGTTVANQFSDLWSGNLLHPINLTEQGQAVGSGHVWTGSTRDGNWDTVADCVDWTTLVSGRSAFTSLYGDLSVSNALWISSSVQEDCSTLNHLYCIEQY